MNGGIPGLCALAAGSAAFLAGMTWGVILVGPRKKRRRTGQEKPNKEGPNACMRSVTRLLFLSTQISALVWVFISYGIAIYSTIRLQQVYTMSELSEPAINALLGVTALKVLGNIFEHNDGPVFGQSKPPAAKQDADGDL